MFSGCALVEPSHPGTFHFPTYLLGSVIAAQLAHCKVNFDAKVELGKFAEIKQWLTDNKVHIHGRRYPRLDALLEDQSGEKIIPKYFIDCLTNKYTTPHKC